jgi:hypothetical protein
MKQLALIAAVTAVIGVWPAASSAATSTGVVVARQRGTLLVASPVGVVRAATGAAAVGSRVVVSGGRVSVVGRSATALIRGIVVRRVGAIVFISSNRHLVAVHAGRGLASVSDHHRPSPADPVVVTTPGTVPPGTTVQPGTIVSSQVAIQNGQLDDEATENLGQANVNSLQVQALVAAVAPGMVTLTVGAQTLTLALPAGLTLPAVLVGQTVTITVTLDDPNAANSDDRGDGDNSGPGGD